jgi:hypothetical protein
MRGVSAQSDTRRWLVACAVVVCAAQTMTAQSAQGLRVTPLVREGQVWVGFELRDGFTPQLRDAIHSGLKTSFTYAVDLRLDVPWWIDRVIGNATVTNTVKFDNRLAVYALEHLVDGRLEKAENVPDEDFVRTFLTQIDKKPLFKTSLLQPNREYYVRVSASARPSNGSILWPFGSGTSAKTKFTFIR